MLTVHAHVQPKHRYRNACEYFVLLVMPPIARLFYRGVVAVTFSRALLKSEVPIAELTLRARWGCKAPYSCIASAVPRVRPEKVSSHSKPPQRRGALVQPEWPSSPRVYSPRFAAHKSHDMSTWQTSFAARLKRLWAAQMHIHFRFRMARMAH